MIVKYSRVSFGKLTVVGPVGASKLGKAELYARNGITIYRDFSFDPGTLIVAGATGVVHHHPWAAVNTSVVSEIVRDAPPQQQNGGQQQQPQKRG